MSRIGNKVIEIPAGVTVDITPENFITVTGPKGKLDFQFNRNIQFQIDGQTLTLVRPSDDFKAIHGTSRALLNSMVVGVDKGFTRRLLIVGVGYRAALTGNSITVSAGYSHPVVLEIPETITVTLPKNTEIIISGPNKQIVGEFAAKVRSIRKPEPYKGKGIAYDDEKIRRKEGKTAKK